ncbi:MAG: iron-sulfur cluster biosynthesis family protein [Candidatus Sedimenticola endophacoides]|uniref:Iron-sulfur cluster assembly accessory protein n=1 Tax=Candidatus Sedimenticola endophacoides TaxID=2548426 RepID=A0A657PWQ3_9GAMM|nr:MAG: iron-sulfur cluster assembly accessory protein [Candidatus Sedimenticola endophacoides]OQX36010.1 MAG: iron-sulfur cluster assembly accessory protein [Candidatus Sedimenticola endophacoides]OQX41109.1 MAG: iron-sulfur cluster assembly accessory protein [Candidatus Sedimenticola endophacoides]OQX46124.1 MAG: iron-sulfur cluster assembly accessory protein [Candidatus Sedimenticola endophacoides]OQX47406.1 MAG: iron-sulfur cluster assembly accessory protein [Candidatus Sedimenticola endoph
MFQLTDKAAAQVREAAKVGGTQGMALRLAARQAPDGSIDYMMGFDDKKDDDIEINASGVEVVIAPEYMNLLSEATMDYVEIEEGDFRFIFMNPADANYTPPPVQE